MHSSVVVVVVVVKRGRPYVKTACVPWDAVGGDQSDQHSPYCDISPAAALHTDTVTWTDERSRRPLGFAGTVHTMLPALMVAGWYTE